MSSAQLPNAFYSNGMHSGSFVKLFQICGVILARQFLNFWQVNRGYTEQTIGPSIKEGYAKELKTLREMFSSKWNTRTSLQSN